MNYDVWGNWSTAVGPNSPLNDTCSSHQEGSAVTFVNDWVQAGFPKSKIVLGMAAYGHTFDVASSEISSAQSLTEYPAFNQGGSQGAEFGDTWTNTGSTDQCGQYVPAGSTMEYWGLMQQGFLTSDGSPESGILHAFDNCSQTDYVYNPETGVAVSYDSPQAFSAKGEFIVSEGLKGFCVWETGGDSHDLLLDAVRSAAGF